MTTTSTDKPALPAEGIPYAQWDFWAALGWTHTEIGAHNTALVEARAEAKYAAATPEYRAWQDRRYINNTWDLCGKDSRRTWIDAQGELHTDITNAEALGHLRAAIERAPERKTTGRTQDRDSWTGTEARERLSDGEFAAWLTRAMDRGGLI